MITNCYSVDVSSKTNSAYDEATKDLEKFLGSLKLKKSTVKNDVASKKNVVSRLNNTFSFSDRSRILRVIESHVAS